MILDTNQLYREINKSISVGIEDLFINRLNKIFSPKNDIELLKVFIGDLLSLSKKIQQAEEDVNESCSFEILIESFEELNNLIERYSDILGTSDSSEIREIKWFIYAIQCTLQGFEIICKSLSQNEAIAFLTMFYEGINIIVGVLEDSKNSHNQFYLNTDIGNLIKYFLLNSQSIIDNKLNTFYEREYENAECYYLSKQIDRAYASASQVIAQQSHINRLKESTIKNLYPDDSSYNYMETQGILFDRALSKLREKYRDMYVYFEDGRVLDYDEDEDTLIDRVLENNNYKDVFIEKV